MMYKFFISLFLIVVPFTQASEYLYLANDGLLEVKKIDPASGKLTDFQKIEHPKLSKFTFSRNKEFLYAQASIKNKPKQLSIITFKVEKTGKLTQLYNAPISSKTNELKTDRSDNFLFGAGHTLVWKLENGVYGDILQKCHSTKPRAIRKGYDQSY